MSKVVEQLVYQAITFRQCMRLLDNSRWESWEPPRQLVLEGSEEELEVKREAEQEQRVKKGACWLQQMLKQY